MIAQYETFIAEFVHLRPKTPEDCFVAYVSLMSRWRLFPFIDPDLPAELLPKGWLRERAYTLFQDRRRRWFEPAQRFVESLEPVDAVTRVAVAVALGRIDATWRTPRRSTS